MRFISSDRAKAMQRMRDLRDAADRIADYCPRGRKTFENDAAVRDAILYRIIVIGEAAKTVMQSDRALADSMSEVEWSPLVRMRDRLTHRYWRTDLEIVWSTASRDIPALRDDVYRALQAIGDDLP